MFGLYKTTEQQEKGPLQLTDMLGRCPPILSTSQSVSQKLFTYISAQPGLSEDIQYFHFAISLYKYRAGADDHPSHNPFMSVRQNSISNITESTATSVRGRLKKEM